MSGLYEGSRDRLLRLVHAPLTPPDSPAGSHDSVEIHRASRHYLTYRLVCTAVAIAAVGLLLLIGIIATAIGGEGVVVGLFVLAELLLVVVAFVAYFAVRIDYEMRYYIVTDRSIRVRQGAWVVKEKTISYANVQNLRVVQGPIQRLFGIWNLKVDAAGGGLATKGESLASGHSIEMAGIENAHEMRDRILQHLRLRPSGSGLGDPDERVERRAASAGPELVGALRELRDAAKELRRAALAARS